MRRMSAGAILTAPSESNKVFCAQFVADEIVINNIDEGYYVIKLTQTDGDNIVYSLLDFDFKYESTYGSIFSPFFYDYNNDSIFALKGEYSGNSKTMTLTLINTQGVVIQSPTAFHIDIYKL